MDFKASYHQERLWFIDKFEAGNLYESNPIYHNIPLILWLKGKIDKESLETSIKFVIDRHTALRTRIITKDNELLQVIEAEYDFKLEYFDLTNYPGEDNVKQANSLAMDFAKKPFKLDVDLLIRGALIQISREECILAISVHHIISDRISLKIIAREIFAFNDALQYREELVLLPLPAQYTDFSQWQHAFTDEIWESIFFYWKRKLNGKLPPLNFPTDSPRAPIHIYHEGNIQFEISTALLTKIENFCLQNNTDKFSFLLCAFQILLFRYANQDEILIGISDENRNQPGLERIVGPIANLLVLRNFLNEKDNFPIVLEKISNTVKESKKYKDMPFEMLDQKLKPPKDMSRTVFFDILFQYDEKPILITANNLDVKIIETNLGYGKYDLNIQFLEYKDSIPGFLVYNRDYFNEATIDRFITHYLNLLESCLENINAKISDLYFLTEKEKNQLLYDFNAMEAEFPRHQTIHQLFEEQLARTPHNIAVVGLSLSLSESVRLPSISNLHQMSLFSIQMTYRELNEKANRIAGFLSAKGIQAGAIVGLLIDRFIEMVIGILGILKSGSAYLPIGLEYPKKRIEYMLDDSHIAWLLAQKELTAELQFKGEVIDILEAKSFQGQNNLQLKLSNPTNLIYIIYTSGTTGNPKGVMIEHRNVVQLLCIDKFQYDFNERDIWTLFHSYCFDFSVWELYGALLYGGKLIIIPKWMAQDHETFLKMLKKQVVTILNQTPATFYYLSEEELKHPGKELHVKYVIFGGDALKPAKLKGWNQKYPLTKLINMYGITETTVHVTFKEITGNDIGENISKIGIPIPTLKAFVLDSGLKLLPLGIPGELYVGGYGVGRGYLNRPGLTQERFIANPYIHGEKFYKSGDLVKMLPGGEMEYLGRTDHQIQVRGYRVELGEIERRLIKYPGIKQSAVITWDIPVKTDAGQESEQLICAYIVPVSPSGIEITHLREYLAAELPDYMIPSYFVQVEKIPLTDNGKLDRQALPEPEVKTIASYTAPRNEIEKKLVTLWAEILGKDELHASQLKASIGIEDNFFDLGGHSLKATILVAKIHKAFNVKVPLGEVFIMPKLRELASYIKEKTKEYFIPIEPCEEKEYYLLSSAQKRLFILQQMKSDSIAYNMPFVVPLPSAIEPGIINQTFKTLIKRHESLRTSFYLENETSVQKIHDIVDFELELLFSNSSNDSLDLLKRFIKPFNLAKAPLLRAGLINENNEKYILIVDIHHIISDGISQETLNKDFLSLYEGKELPPLRIQYKDFSEWQNSGKEKENLKRQEKYWLQEFAGEVPALDLPTDYPRPMEQSFEGDSVNFNITENETQALKTIALSEGATLFMVLMGINNILFSKLSGQEDIVIGTAIAGRRHEDLEKIIGMFVNSLSLRNFPVGNRSFRNFLGELKERTLFAFENQEYPFEELVDKLSLHRDIGRNPLFDIMFVMQNMNSTLPGKDKNIDIDSNRVVQPDSTTKYDNIYQIAKFDLTLNAVEINLKLHLSFEYCTSLFKNETIERFIYYFKKIVSTAIKEPDIRLNEIEIISVEEKKRILCEFNDTEANYPKDKTIHRIFEEQVEMTPNNIALIGPSLLAINNSSLQITYQELDENANRFAHKLHAKGGEPDTIVGIMLERSIELVVGILAVLKCGGAYLPIDPDYPGERINYMLIDSGAAFSVTGNDFEGFDKNLSTQLPDSSLSFPTSMAYIIYTSGTTGHPKGTIIEHGNVVRLLFNEKFQFDFNHNDTWTMFHSPCFDFSVWEMYGALLYGGKLLVIPRITAMDMEKYWDILKKNCVTILNQTPSAFYNLSNLEMNSPEKKLSTRYVIFGGEALTPSRLQGWMSKYPGARYINMYGITETTVHVTFKELKKRDVELNISNIGKPIPTLSTYVLDKNQKLLPIGVAGELYVGGKGVGRGYLNRPELSKEKFIENPYQVGEKLYKSGDLVKLLTMGELQYLGRIDYQVKIRGFRIELGEIENRLLKLSGIKEAVVLAKEEGNENKYICAYFVSDKEYDMSELRHYFSKELPDYMIPSHFVRMEKIPLTPNGKIDLKALPDPILKARESYTAPRSEIEKKLVELWSIILGRNKSHTSQLQTSIGIDDNFFELGGHSLKATILVSMIHKVFTVKVPLIEIFNAPSIKELAKYINGKNQESYLSIEPVEKREYFCLSSAQKRLYILHKIKLDSIAYNIPEIIPLPAAFTFEKTNETFKKLIKRHESLRTSFRLVNDTPVQVVHDEIEFELDLYDFKESHDLQNLQNPKNLLKQFIRPFDLSKPPLIRAGIVKEGDSIKTLIVDMHHIISDGVSQEIFIRDFLSLYGGADLLPLRVQYKDFSEWQNGEKEKVNLKRQEKYWLQEFEEEIPVLEMPNDYIRPLEQSFDGDSVHFQLGNEETRALKAMILAQGATLFMGVMAIYNILLAKLSSQEDIVIGTAVAGRRHADLDKIIGMFVNTLSMRNYPRGGRTFRDFLEEVKERTLMAFENQQYPFEELVDKLSVKRDVGRNPLFDVMFVLQNMNTDRAGKDKEIEITSTGTVQSESPKENGDIFQVTKFDLTLRAMEIGRDLFLTFQYCTKLFKKETIERFILYFKKILSCVVNETGIKIREIEMISEQEKSQILNDFNNTEVEYPKDKTIHELFQDQVERTPDCIAVMGMSAGEIQISYRQLNEKSNQLARILRCKAVKNDSIVGIRLQPSVERFIGILGILKAGGAYMAIDPESPPKRTNALLNDCNSSILLTDLNSMRKHSFTETPHFQSTGGTVIRTPSRRQILDLDNMPMTDRSLVNYDKYNRFLGEALVEHCISLQATRGCPYNCSYCHKIWPKGHVIRSAENIFEELKVYYNMGVRRFAFIDDIFNLDIKNSSRFFQLIIQNNIEVKIFFPNGLRGDILTKDYIDLMVSAGTTGISLALETASPRLQKLLNKNLNIEKLRLNLEYICQKYPQVILELYIMHGFPTETKEEAVMTLDFLKSIKWAHFPLFNILKIFPNTDMAKIAVENGISIQSIAEAEKLAFHELPATLPFDRNFTKMLQVDYLNNYFLLKERLVSVLPYQMKVLTENEIIKKYNTYLALNVKNFEELLRAIGISKDELASDICLDENSVSTPGLNTKMEKHFHFQEAPVNALRILLLDLSQSFSYEAHQLNDLVEPPLGLMCLLTYINKKFEGRIRGRIAKSFIDFDSFDELRKLIDEFKPDLIGIRTLSFYKDFFHRAVAKIREWGILVPLISGGPYATCNYEIILQDHNVDLAVIGEGEVTFGELIGKMLENGGKLPAEEELEKIAGVAYIKGKEKITYQLAREIILLEQLPELLAKEPADNLEMINRPSDLAYNIFTSGSTGIPKGVIVEHRNIVRLVKNTNFISFNENDRILQTGAMDFDASTFEVWGSLLNGLSLYLLTKDKLLSPGLLKEAIRKYNIHIMWLTSLFFNQMLDADEEIFTGLSCLLVGGDELSPLHINRLRKKFPGLKVINGYGPTENTTFSTTFLIEKEYRENIPIGKPIANSLAYIIDASYHIVPINVAGEIIVGGDGVSRGYLNRPELTAEKFIYFGHQSPITYRYSPHIFYRTGDLGRWLPEGNIEFLGRIDQQIKIRGFRIELGEIENCMVKVSGIKEAVALAREGDKGDKYICVYFVSDREYGISELRELLSKELPGYMIPSFFVQIDKIPLTTNGKIDWKALPEQSAISAPKENSRPPYEEEEKLIVIWAEIIGIEKDKIGIEQNLFELGGNSLHLISFVSRIHKEFGIEAPIVRIFENPTIKAIALWIKSNNYVDSPVISMNPQAKKKLFLFPPHLPYGGIFLGLSSIITDYAFYAFNFIEEEDRLEQYFKLITNSQPEGSYILFGYSAAGRLTCEVARVLEDRGYEVSDIIFVDCFFTEGDAPKFNEVDLKLNRESKSKLMDKLGVPFLKEKVIKKMEGYMKYICSVDHLKKINAQVHLLITEEAKENKDANDPECWDQVSSKKTLIYDVDGTHNSVLLPGDVEKTAVVIRDILDRIEVKSNS